MLTKIKTITIIYKAKLLQPDHELFFAESELSPALVSNYNHGQKI